MKATPQHTYIIYSTHMYFFYIFNLRVSENYLFQERSLYLTLLFQRSAQKAHKNSELILDNSFDTTSTFQGRVASLHNRVVVLKNLQRNNHRHYQTLKLKTRKTLKRHHPFDLMVLWKW